MAGGEKGGKGSMWSDNTDEHQLTRSQAISFFRSLYIELISQFVDRH